MEGEALAEPKLEGEAPAEPNKERMANKRVESE